VSYLHCPTCACAYNLARERACPRCGVRAGTPPADPTDDIIHAVEELARAMARATPIEIIAAQRMIDWRTKRLALPAPGKPTGPSPQMLRAVRAAIDGPKFDDAPPVYRARWRMALDAAVARLAPQLPARAGIGSRLDHAKGAAKSLARRAITAAARF
jgi:hypothetical protein